jgi:hypothetical protein
MTRETYEGTMKRLWQEQTDKFEKEKKDNDPYFKKIKKLKKKLKEQDARIAALEALIK